MSDKQRTIKKAVSITGKGLHTGVPVTLTFNPAPENHWLKFQRTDVEGQPIIDADCDLVVDTSRGTTLEKNGVRVHTTEHVLAALVGLGIDNCLIQVSGPEMPIMDGSSIQFIEALETVEIVEQEAERVQRRDHRQWESARGPPWQERVPRRLWSVLASPAWGSLLCALTRSGHAGLGVTVTRMSFGNGANVARDPSLREAISIPTKGDRRLSYAA